MSYKLLHSRLYQFLRSFTTMAIAKGRPPALTNPTLVKIINQFYKFASIEADSIKHFPGYDDRNFYFRGVPTDSKKEAEFVLKIFNSLHSSHDVVVGISEIWTHIASKGFTYSSCLRNWEKKAVTFVPKSLCEEANVSGSTETYAVRILHFVSGELFDSIDKQYLTPKLMREAGTFLGQLDAALKDGFHNTAIGQRKNVDWDLSHLLHMRIHLPAMDNLSRRAMVEKIVNDFESFVQPKMPSFSRGVLHGDANGMNLIVKENESDEYQIAGLIDFDDTVLSCHVFEIAIFLAYIMIENLNPIDYPSPVEFVGTVLQGYLQVFPLSKDEINCLYYLVLGRCCQSAVLGEIAYKAEPWNSYLLTTPEKAYKLMEILLAMGKENVDMIWVKAC